MATLRDWAITAGLQPLRLAFRPFNHPPRSLAPKSIVVIKPCCIGDVLMATAAIAEVRRAFPKAMLSVAVGPWARDVLAGNPRIDDLIDCRSVGGGRATAWSDYRDLVRDIRVRKFDLAIVLDRSPLLSTIPSLAGVPWRAGIDSGGRGFALNVRVAWPRRRHEAELYLDVVRALGVEVSSANVEFFPAAQDIQWAGDALSSGDARATKGPQEYVALHVGGGANPYTRAYTKRWLPERWGEVANRLRDAGKTLMFVGGDEDQEAIGIVLGLSGRMDSVVNLAGQTNLSRLGAVIQRCQLYIGVDSGPLHIAAAVGTPAIGLYGPSDPQVYGPYAPRASVIYRPEPGDPCSSTGPSVYGDQPCACMRNITVDDVWQAVVRELGLFP